MNKSTFQTQLFNWYDRHARVLPWRSNPSPYRVWISEIMLQQTRVEAVVPYFDHFMNIAPNIESLHNLSEDQAIKLWEGLGYYSRIKNIKKTAEIIIRDFKGFIPENKQDLESLPGIGPYTSQAILSIAYNQKAAAIDGNVLRVFARLLELKEDIKNPKTKQVIRTTVESLLPEERNNDFTQALMEIGATVCLPNGTPKCMICPLRDLCLAFKHSTQEQIPIKQKKKTRSIIHKNVYLYKYDNLYAIEQRPNTGLLASLFQFPNDEEAVVKSHKLYLGSSKHVFSHLIWEMDGYLIDAANKSPQYIWVTREELVERYAIPTAFKAFTKYIKNTL